MVRFPVFESLRVDGYGLFPGASQDGDGLHTTFYPGLTLVLGANGLGKTTLVSILYRLLTGPYDIPGLDTAGDLGRRKLEAKPLREARHLFSKRVSDDAKNAVAHLAFRLGDNVISVTRNLNNLTLVTFEVDGQRRSTQEKESYQCSIAQMAGVWSFGDWILLLRHLTFYFEDRRELVWDKSAQTQTLRFLFLPEETAKRWTEAERQILQLDSRARNLNAAITREEKALGEEEVLADSALDIREELKSFTQLQDTDEQRRDDLDSIVLEFDMERKEARLRLMQAEQERESVFRALEHAKLTALEARFPRTSDTARYILGQLLTEAECLACGNIAVEAAAILEKRLSDSQCIVCGTPLQQVDSATADLTTDLSKKRMARATLSLARADTAVIQAREELLEADSRYEAARAELQALEVAIAQRRERIDMLIRRMPKDEIVLHEQREELGRLRSRADSLKEELSARRKDFSKFIEGVTGALLTRAPVIKKLFEQYAKDFLIEECELVWSLRKDRVGQLGMTISFPAFELDLASAAFTSPVRRTGPEQVSESQREFIDLAFRMALMAAADPSGGGTLVIDAPESSLDAVFVHRAAEVLTRFASSGTANRLIITSNLTEGDLIPRLLHHIGKGDRAERVIDLFEVAEPTAAVRQLKAEYLKVKKRVFAAPGVSLGHRK